MSLHRHAGIHNLSIPQGSGNQLEGQLLLEVHVQVVLAAGADNLQGLHLILGVQRRLQHEQLLLQVAMQHRLARVQSVSEPICSPPTAS